MPTLIDEPELQFTRRLFESAKPSGLNPQAQIGAWAVWQGFLQTFERTVVWPSESVSPEMVQTYRAFVTTVLGMGEHLLTLPLASEDRETVELSVRFFRDKLVMEFSEATSQQSEALLTSIFALEAAAN